MSSLDPVIKIKTLSLRGCDFIHFADKVFNHIETYTVPQYGDKGEDQMTNYTAKELVQQSQKYMSRYGRNAREGQQELDFLKAVHCLQMAHDKYLEESQNETNQTIV
jgi:hypothetical protein